jgi:hypothetical protein
MRIYRPNRTNFWHYEFVLNGKRYHKSTKMTNEREAPKITGRAHLFRQTPASASFLAGPPVDLYVPDRLHKPHLFL